MPTKRPPLLAQQGQQLISSWSHYQQGMFNPSAVVEYAELEGKEKPWEATTKRRTNATNRQHPRDTIVTPPSVSNRRRFFSQGPPKSIFGFPDRQAADAAFNQTRRAPFGYDEYTGEFRFCDAGKRVSDMRWGPKTSTIKQPHRNEDAPAHNDIDAMADVMNWSVRKRTNNKRLAQRLSQTNYAGKRNYIIPKKEGMPSLPLSEIKPIRRTISAIERELASYTRNRTLVGHRIDLLRNIDSLKRSINELIQLTAMPNISKKKMSNGKRIAAEIHASFSRVLNDNETNLHFKLINKSTHKSLELTLLRMATAFSLNAPVAKPLTKTSYQTMKRNKSESILTTGIELESNGHGYNRRVVDQARIDQCDKKRVSYTAMPKMMSSKSAPLLANANAQIKPSFTIGNLVAIIPGNCVRPDIVGRIGVVECRLGGEQNGEFVPSPVDMVGLRLVGAREGGDDRVKVLAANIRHLSPSEIKEYDRWTKTIAIKGGSNAEQHRYCPRRAVHTKSQIGIGAKSKTRRNHTKRKKMPALNGKSLRERDAAAAIKLKNDAIKKRQMQREKEQLKIRSSMENEDIARPYTGEHARPVSSATNFRILMSRQERWQSSKEQPLREHLSNCVLSDDTKDDLQIQLAHFSGSNRLHPSVSFQNTHGMNRTPFEKDMLQSWASSFNSSIGRAPSPSSFLRSPPLSPYSRSRPPSMQQRPPSMPQIMEDMIMKDN